MWNGLAVLCRFVSTGIHAQCTHDGKIHFWIHLWWIDKWRNFDDNLVRKIYYSLSVRPLRSVVCVCEFEFFWIYVGQASKWSANPGNRWRETIAERLIIDDGNSEKNSKEKRNQKFVWQTIRVIDLNLLQFLLLTIWPFAEWLATAMQNMRISWTERLASARAQVTPIRLLNDAKIFILCIYLHFRSANRRHRK